MFLLPEEARKEAFRQKSVRIGTIVFFLVSGIFLVWAGNGELSIDEYTVVAGDVVENVSDIPVGDVVVAPPEHVQTAYPKLVGELPAEADVLANGVMLRDRDTEKILYSKAPQGQHSMASITKLMTALVLYDTGVPWISSATVTAAESLGTHMYAGDTYETEDLWLSMLVGSSNKAALTLVDLTATTSEAFIFDMNAKAKSLGMLNTTFADPTGLSARNISTPSDILILLDAALQVSPIREALRTTEHTIYSNEREKSHHMWNTNWLLLRWVPHDLHQVVGGKTGYIDASGYNFTARVVTKEGRTFDAVVLGASTHEERFSILRDVVDSVSSAYVWN